MLNIQQMKYVAAIANNGSFREAAKNYLLHNPSLSNSIRELEEELGISSFYVPIRALFNRRRNGFRTSRESLSSNGVIGKSLSRDSDQRTILHLFATLRFLGEVIAKVLKSMGINIKIFVSLKPQP